MKRVLIVCIGNELVADDGIGQVLYEQLQGYSLEEGIRLKFLGLGGIDLIDELRGEDLLIVVDGVQLGRTVGELVVLDWDDLPVSEGRPVSGHGIGIREAIAVATKLSPSRCPKKVLMVGIEGGCFNKLGVGLTPEVRAAIPLAIEKIVELAKV